MLHNVGISSSASVLEYLEVNTEVVTERLDIDLQILENIHSVPLLEMIYPERIAFLALLLELRGKNIDTLIAEYASEILSRVLRYESSRLASRLECDFEKAIVPVRRCLHHLSASEIEGSFLVFLHDFGQSWNDGGDAVFQVLALRILNFYTRLVPSLILAHSAKLLPIMAEAYVRTDVVTFKDDLADISQILLGLPLLPESLELALKIGNTFLEPNCRSTELSLKPRENLLATLPISLLLRFVEQKLFNAEKKSEQFSNEETVLYQSILERAVNSVGLDAGDRLKAQELLISIGTGLDSSRGLSSALTTPEDQNICCYSQIHMIRFAVHHLKVLLKSIGLEADISKRNSLAFTIQKLCRYLNLHSDKSEVWDAFDSSQKESIQPFLSSKYRFDFELSSHPSPIVLKAVDLPDWISSMFCQINSYFDFDPEVQSFMRTFAAIVLYNGAAHFDIIAAFVISTLIRIESFAVTLSQEYTANPCLNLELNQVTEKIDQLCIYQYRNSWIYMT